MSRPCEVCRRAGRDRLMRDELRHLHELDEGDAFRVPGTDVRDVLEEVGVGRCYGEDVGPMAPTTSVEPIP